LARLGVEAEPPSLDMLTLVVQRHAERVPYETLWIPAGERWSIDPIRAAWRIAFAGRGGYCYHLNGALGLLLRSLGYAVHGHVGGVQADGEPSTNAMGNHLVLTVTDLPSDINPSGQWYVDTGLGDALHEPLPLAPPNTSGCRPHPNRGSCRCRWPSAATRRAWM
jgi:arylamine N-acetyltransferase